MEPYVRASLMHFGRWFARSIEAAAATAAAIVACGRSRQQQQEGRELLAADEWPIQ